MITENQKIHVAVISFLAGIIVAFLFYPKPETEEVYKFTTKTEIDTVFIQEIDTLHVTKKEIKTEFLRDTILIDFKPKISQFNASFPFEHGSTKVSGEVLGEVLKMTATNEYNIPVVTNTITNTETKTIIHKPKGLYLGANVNSMLQPSASVTYLDNKYLFQYQFEPLQRVHQIGVAKKLF